MVWAMFPLFKKRAQATPGTGPGGGSGAGQGRERRQGERLVTAVVSCDLGIIVDVSRTGVCIRTDRRPGMNPGSEVVMDLSAPTDGVTVHARLVRVKRVPGGRWEAAFTFVNVSEEVGTAIESLARTGRCRSVGNNSGAWDGPQKEALIAALRLPDYYAELGISSTAGPEEVQRAFRAMARKYHPDVCREEGAQAKFCAINEAYAVLYNPEKRREYDRMMALRRAA